MRRPSLTCLLALLLALALPLAVLLGPGAGPARADEGEAESPAGSATLRVGTKVAPPFAFRDAQGRWVGLAVELWERVAADLDVRVEWRETSLEGLLSGLTDGSLDASVAALTMTADREEKVDFTHPFFTSGLGIATQTRPQAGLGAVLARVFSGDFLRVLLVLVAVLAGAGFLLWLCERRRNAAQFGGGTARGFGSAFWWSAVTMTTVGYGDKAPITFGGRLIAMVWMFASMLIIASITASIASALTVSRLEGTIRGPEDLPGLTVGTVPQSTSDRWLAQRGIRRLPYDSVEAALAALSAGECDAVVYDHPLLVYHVRTDRALGEALTVLPRTFARQDYAVALPPGDPRREEVNRALLAEISSAAWDDLRRRYLGS